MLQCSKYDNKSYKGVIFEWTSFHHNAGECELKCMPKGERFFVTFKKKVIDGTPCNLYTNDVCVNGTCLPVGCDMQLYSNAKVDNCGVCNGDGSSCRVISSNYQLSTDAYGK